MQVFLIILFYYDYSKDKIVCIILKELYYTNCGSSSKYDRMSRRDILSFVSPFL